MKERGGGGGGVTLLDVLVHINVLEHIVCLCFRTAWWLFMKLGRDEVLMAPHFLLDFFANPAQRWIQGGAKIGQWGVRSPDCFFRLEGYSYKANA